ncbi:MAG: hypothetical protein LC112_00170 [Flavobacteriales bacterium]|nr:hypothetical protein [Flavobacteriales bacterium]
MKKTFFALSVLTCISIYSQKKYINIINSTNIAEIENFLKEAHPDDSRRFVLKRRLVELKNSSWMNRGKNKAQGSTSTNIISVTTSNNNKTEIKTSPFSSLNEEQEFRKLISETSAAHKEKTLKLLNQLFDNDDSNNKAILLIKNEGDCNMIIRIHGNEHYNLAVPAHGENFVTVSKGDYQLSGNMCEANYSSRKSIGKNMLVTLHKTTDLFSAKQQLGANGSGTSN